MGEDLHGCAEGVGKDGRGEGVTDFMDGLGSFGSEKVVGRVSTDGGFSVVLHASIMLVVVLGRDSCLMQVVGNSDASFIVCRLATYSCIDSGQNAGDACFIETFLSVG